LTKPRNRGRLETAKNRREVSDIAYIEVSDDEPLEKAIKRFKRQVEKEGIIREWKKREFFEKPSAILNRKKKALERKRMKRARKVSQMKSY
jgi:small subunit ribosomal protein S21